MYYIALRAHFISQNVWKVFCVFVCVSKIIFRGYVVVVFFIFVDRRVSSNRLKVMKIEKEEATASINVAWPMNIYTNHSVFPLFSLVYCFKDSIENLSRNRFNLSHFASAVWSKYNFNWKCIYLFFFHCLLD